MFAQATPSPSDQKSGPAASDHPQGAIEILSNTMGVDFSAYLAEVLKRVRLNWYGVIPDAARPPLMKKGKVSIDFAIVKDGSIKGMKLTEASGDTSLDRAAWAGIAGSNPFPALPAEFRGDYLALKFHFYYNPDKPVNDKPWIEPPAPFAVLKDRAESGNAQAQVQLGRAYASGNGVAKDEAEAVRWFRRAAEQGDAAAEDWLGKMYLSGRGVAANPSEGAYWIRKAVEQGDAHAEFDLAVMYAQGRGVAKDENEAAKWMQKAADQGLARAQFELGVMYARGRGVSQNESAAAAWYRKAADQGNAAAMNNLAFLLATSSDPNLRNPQEALPLAQAAAGANPTAPEHWDTLARAYFETGQPAKAVEAERKAVELKPDKFYKEALAKYRVASR